MKTTTTRTTKTITKTTATTTITTTTSTSTSTAKDLVCLSSVLSEYWLTCSFRCRLAPSHCHAFRETRWIPTAAAASVCVYHGAVCLNEEIKVQVANCDITSV